MKDIEILKTENSGVIIVKSNTSFWLPKDPEEIERYAESAIALIDAMSSEKPDLDGVDMSCNSLGITIMLGMLLILKDGIGYYGKPNGCPINVTPAGVKDWILNQAH